MLNKKLLCALIVGMIAVPSAVYLIVPSQSDSQDDLYRHDVWEHVFTFVGIERVNATHLAINYLEQFATHNETTGGSDISYSLVKTEIYNMCAINITVIHFFYNSVEPRVLGVHYFYHYFDNISEEYMFRNTNYETRTTTFSDQLGHEHGIIDNITIPLVIWTPETEALFVHDQVMAWVVENGTAVYKMTTGQVSKDENGAMIFKH